MLQFDVTVLDKSQPYKRSFLVLFSKHTIWNNHTKSRKVFFVIGKLMQKHSRSFSYKRGDLVLSFILFSLLLVPLHISSNDRNLNTISFTCSLSHSLPYFLFTTFYSCTPSLFPLSSFFGIIFGQCIKQLSIKPLALLIHI